MLPVFEIGVFGVPDQLKCGGETCRRWLCWVSLVLCALIPGTLAFTVALEFLPGRKDDSAPSTGSQQSREIPRPQYPRARVVGRARGSASAVPGELCYSLLGNQLWKKACSVPHRPLVWPFLLLRNSAAETCVQEGAGRGGVIEQSILASFNFSVISDSVLYQTSITDL